MNLLNTPKVNKALEMATKAHLGQKRWGGIDYITHPVAIAEKFDTEELQIIALLHDTIEDTDLSYNDIYRAFDYPIADSVLYLTKVGDEPYEDYIENLAQNGSIQALKVKLADLEHNISDLEASYQKTKYKLTHLYLTEILNRKLNNVEQKTNSESGG